MLQLMYKKVGDTMERFDVRDADRKVKRNIQKVFGDDFLKIITELILNSDDSYNRLEATKTIANKPCLIELHLNRKKRIITVTDQAEGMSKTRMKEIFIKYGGDNSGAHFTKNVRGLFGQGASDVLFLSAFHGYDAQIISIKDSLVSRCNFLFTNHKEIGIDDITNELSEFRKRYGIKKNGTIVKFGLPENIKIPKQKEIKSKIESFYMLRYILANSKRDVVLYDGRFKHRLHSTRFLAKEHNILLEDRSITLHFDEEVLKTSLTVFEKEENEPLRVIIKDENNVVYDDTLFGLENTHGSRFIAGEFTIFGISNLLRTMLNAKKPEEILRDSRDGFDGRHRFTKNMNNTLRDVIGTVIETNNKRRESISYSLNENKKLLDALRKINSYFNELELTSITGINAGKNLVVDGIRFARPAISITRKKIYGLHLYINPNLIDEFDVITIEMEETKHITIENRAISYKTKDRKDPNIVIKSVIIEANRRTKEPILLKAICKEYEAQVLIDVVQEKIIYPENGLEFIPKRKELEPTKTSHFSLYFDTEYIPADSYVDVSLSYESMLFPKAAQFIVKKEHMISESIGLIKIPIHAHDYDEKIVIEASSNDIFAEALCYVKERKNKDEGNEGILSRLELVFDKGNWQSSVIPNKGILQINGSHIINKTIMGNLGGQDPKHPDFNLRQLKYLYELVALESSRLFVKEKYIQLEHEHKDLEGMMNEIQEHKTILYADLIQSE